MVQPRADIDAPKRRIQYTDTAAELMKSLFPFSHGMSPRTYGRCYIVMATKSHGGIKGVGK